MIYCELVFTQSVKFGPFNLCLWISNGSAPCVKKVCLLVSCFCTFVNNRKLCSCGAVSGLTILLHCSRCLAFCCYCTVLMDIIFNMLKWLVQAVNLPNFTSSRKESDPKGFGDSGRKSKFSTC